MKHRLKIVAVLQNRPVTEVPIVGKVVKKGLTKFTTIYCFLYALCSNTLVSYANFEFKLLNGFNTFSKIT